MMGRRLSPPPRCVPGFHMSEVIIVGCGAIGCAVASRLSTSGRRPVLVSRSGSSIERARRLVPDAQVAANVADALSAAPDAPVFLTVDSVASARAVLAGCLDAHPARLFGRTVFVALFDEPVRLDALVRDLTAAGARACAIGFLATPDQVRSGGSSFVSDAGAGSLESGVLSLLGNQVVAPSPTVVAELSLAAPALYGALTVLQAWAVGWVTRNGVPAQTWFESGAADPFLAAPCETFRALRDGASLGMGLTVDALQREWLRVAEASPALGIDARVPGTLAALLVSVARGRSLDECFGAGPAPGADRDQRLAAALNATLRVSSVGVPARLVGLGFQLLLGCAWRRLGRYGLDAQALLLPVADAVEAIRRPLSAARAAERFRWTPSLYAEPLVPTGLLATELGHAASTVPPDDPAMSWTRLLSTLYTETAARHGDRADLTAVYDVLVSPRRSTRKTAALEQTREFISPGRVSFFEGAGVPFVMGRRNGPYLADIDDTRVLLNLHCNGGVFNFGHRPAALFDVLAQATTQVDIGNHHLLSEVRPRLARRLAESMPAPLRRVAFAPSATEITDFAIRLARAATGRRRVLSFVGSFHGTAGLGAHAGDERFFAWAGPRAHEFLALPRWDLAALQGEIEKGDVALVLLETVQASSGMHLPPHGFYRELSRLCRTHGTVLALDEVQCGWGRSGRLWAFEHFDVVPDIVILGKGMSGGVYPMAGCCYDPRLGTALERDPFVHQSTGGGSELGCAVTERILDLVQAPGFLPRVNALAARVAERLDVLAREMPLVATVHQLGLFISVGFVSPQLGPLVTKACFDRGLLVMFSGLSPDFVQVLPPLTLDDDEAEWALARFAEAIEEVAAMASALSGGAWEPVPAVAATGVVETRDLTLDGRDLTPGSGLCGSMDPRLPDLLQWSPGEPSQVARVVGTIPGLNADVSIVEFTIAGRRERFVMKPLPGFAPERRYDEYAALIDEYVVRLRRCGIRCLDTWMVSRGGKKTAWVVQAALPLESLLPARLAELSRGERQAVFRRIVAFAQAALAGGCGLDAHFANWALPSAHELDPILLDVTQPLLRDGAGRIRMVYGAAGVPLPVERYLSNLLSSDLFELEPLVLDIVANLRLDPALAGYEGGFLEAVREQAGLTPAPAAVERAARKVRRMRGTLRTLRTLVGDARSKPQAS